MTKQIFTLGLLCSGDSAPAQISMVGDVFGKLQCPTLGLCSSVSRNADSMASSGAGEHQSALQHESTALD
jgi:hypothetical protein